MNELKYVVEQIWLAHREAGLGAWVEAQLWLFGVLAAAWLFGWLWISAKLIARTWRRMNRVGSRILTSGWVASAPADKPPSWLAGTSA